MEPGQVFTSFEENLDNNTSTFDAFNNHVCHRCNPWATFKRAGDLTRHQNEKHNPTTASKYLCPMDKCPRGIPGEGFGRMYHLVAHLTSKKHDVDRKEAMFIARQHNLPKSKRKDVGQGL